MTTNYIKQRLLELITAQDSVTHCNENKLLDECRQHQAVRDEIRAAIAEDFERLEAERDSARSWSALWKNRAKQHRYNERYLAEVDVNNTASLEEMCCLLSEAEHQRDELLAALKHCRLAIAAGRLDERDEVYTQHFGPAFVEMLRDVIASVEGKSNED